MYGYFWQDWFCYDSILENYRDSELSYDEFLFVLIDAYFDFCDRGNWYEVYSEPTYY